MLLSFTIAFNVLVFSSTIHLTAYTGANQKTNEKYSLKIGDILSFENKNDIQCLKNDVLQIH